MRKAFICSLCHNGILGGGLYLDRQSVTYVCQKLTVAEKYRKLVLPLNEIQKVSWKWVVFPVAIFHMHSGEKHKIIIFNKWRIEKWLQEYRPQLEISK